MYTSSFKPRSRITATVVGAADGGDLVRLGGCVAGAFDRPVAAAGSDDFAAPAAGARKITCDDGETFAVGDEVWVDASTEQAEPLTADLDFSEDYCVGICCRAKVASSGELYVVYMPLEYVDRHNVIAPLAYEFDCDGDNGDTDDHQLIPSWQNRHGLVLELAYARVTEQFAGTTEDQGVVTVYDDDDNALCTLTPSDAGADAVGDVVIGTNPVIGGSTGDAIKTVAAGKGIYAKVTQQTTGGTPAGKLAVHLKVSPLI